MQVIEQTAEQISEAVTSFLDGVETRRLAVQDTLHDKTRDDHGQFFTPMKASEIIASQLRLPLGNGRVRILDPGAGIGSLIAALLTRVLCEMPGVPVEITAVEIDPVVMPHLNATLVECEKLGRNVGTSVTVSLRHGNLLDLAVGVTSDGSTFDAAFDLVIQNPPYYKLDANTRHSLAPAGVDAPNIYAVFLLLSERALDAGGRLVAITPRSFANGRYFTKFRQQFFGCMALNRIHQFDSRGKVFADGGVLQETVIFSATKGGARDTVTIAFSHSADDDPTVHEVPYAGVIDPADTTMVVRIPTSADDTATADVFSTLPATVNDLGIKVSTGKVVDFRARKAGHLRSEAAGDTVPMIYPANVKNGGIDWPQINYKKEQALLNASITAKLRVPGERFVLVKRFSAREERRRVVAGVYEPTEMPPGDVGFDNKLNYFHTDGHGFERNFAWGLCLWLNSTLVDDHFRTVSGNTQVNSTDLNSIRYPSRERLAALGAAHEGTRLPGQDHIDALIAAHALRPSVGDEAA